LSGEETRNEFSLLEGEIQELEERVKRLEIGLNALQKAIAEAVVEAFQKYDKAMAEKVAQSIAIAIFAQSARRKPLFDELEQVRSIAMQRGKTVPEVVAELEQKGTLPPALTAFKKLQKSILETIQVWG